MSKIYQRSLKLVNEYLKLFYRQQQIDKQREAMREAMKNKDNQNASKNYSFECKSKDGKVWEFKPKEKYAEGVDYGHKPKPLKGLDAGNNYTIPKLPR